jgi:hypothetical protein
MVRRDLLLAYMKGNIMPCMGHRTCSLRWGLITKSRILSFTCKKIEEHFLPNNRLPTPIDDSFFLKCPLF